MKIIALTTCHNRRDITLRALDSLYKQSLPEDCSLEVCLVDDGSTDDTSESVKSTYPKVTILKGAGDLYWAGGMRFGWEQFVQQQDFDYLLVFNDDVELYRYAIESLLSAATEVTSTGNDTYAITGAFRESTTGEIAYGGVVHNSRWHPLRFGKIEPTEHIQECDTLNMNLVLISKQALKQIGFLSRDFSHGKADYDFGLRLKAAGGRIVLTPGYIGECSTNPVTGTSEEPGILFRERWRRLTSIKEQPPRQRALYYRRHGGWIWPIFWMLPYLRICLSGNSSIKKNKDNSILSILPVLGHPRHAKRIAMLKKSGFNIEAVAFERDYHKGRLPDCPVKILGKISQGRYLIRIFRLITIIPKLRNNIRQNDLVYTFGLDMALAAVVAGIGMNKPIILEVGDIRKIQSSNGVIGIFVRAIEQFVVNRCKLLVVTAQGFIDGYYHKMLDIKTDSMVLENKLESKSSNDEIKELPKGIPFIDRPLRIGYFGMLRCDWSWRVLEAWAISRPDEIEIDVAGLPVIPANIPERAKSILNINFQGEYRSPDDLPMLYGNVDLIWGCQPYTDSKDFNFPFALSNRLYEACYYQRPIINRIGSGNAELAKQLGIGIGVGGTVEDAIKILNNINVDDISHWRKNIHELPQSIYEYTTEEKELKKKICGFII